MKILVINTGSSSIKYELFEMQKEQCMASGVIERIGETSSLFNHSYLNFSGQLINLSEKLSVMNHRVGLNRILELLLHDEHGIVKDKHEIQAIGHRVVHGGEDFKEPVLINESVISAIKDNIPLAPLHNPPNLIGIEVARAIFPDTLQVAVFDTAFHQTIPEKAFLYALPLDLHTKNKVRRYGFHGTSHSYVAEVAAKILSKPLTECNFISVHLGNGASMAAIEKGRSIDTSMGMTPLEGLVMGTRCGDIDPAIPFFLASYLNLPLKDIDTLLNKESGLYGLCGMTDMRDIQKACSNGSKIAKKALEVYTYRIKKYIGAYYAILGRLDAIILTAGIGEKSEIIRELFLSNLSHLGIVIDSQKNQAPENYEISSKDSKVKLLVIPTNEELKIAQETKKVIEIS